jgi:hypothetical protein
VWVAAVAAGLSLSLFARLDNIDLAALHCRYIRSYARVLCAPRTRVALFATQSAGMCNTREHMQSHFPRFEKYCFMCFPATEALNM